MRRKHNLIFVAAIALSLALTGCEEFSKDSARETILDKIVCKQGNRLIWPNLKFDSLAATNILIVDFNSGQTIKSIGDCQILASPYSTFKIALSLMGFDSGIFKNENSPEWPYKAEYNAPFDFGKQLHTPKTWIQNSCVWYSKQLTSILGIEKFTKYVKDFGYGNQDISGNPGKNDGLTAAWLDSSLKITPQQQVEFIQKLLSNALPVSIFAHEQTKKILFQSDFKNGWNLYAKTGGGGTWFVGWLTNSNLNKTYIFACLVNSNSEQLAANHDIAKQAVLNELKKIEPLNF